MASWGAESESCVPKMAAKPPGEYACRYDAALVNPPITGVTPWEDPAGVTATLIDADRPPPAAVIKFAATRREPVTTSVARADPAAPASVADPSNAPLLLNVTVPTGVLPAGLL